MDSEQDQAFSLKILFRHQMREREGGVSRGMEEGESAAMARWSTLMYLAH